jgi:uncharacterized protein
MDSAAIIIKDSSANPGPLGLFGFGMTTVLLNLHNAGIIQLDSMILAMGICYGGLAQIVAGIMEYKKNNTFGTTAFLSYGFFWLSLVVLVVMPKWGWTDAASGGGMISYFILWGFFTLFLFFGTLRINKALQFIFATLTLLFFLLAAVEITGSSPLKIFTGYEGILCGASAIYTGAAILLNEVNGKSVLPVGPVSKINS